MVISPDLAKDERYDRLFIILLGVVAVLIAATFRDYGYSWDEVAQNRWYGEAVLRFLSTWGADTSAITTENFYLYGGTYDAVAEFLVRFSPLAARNTRHLFNAMAGLTGIVGCWKLARSLGGPGAGFWAALFLTVSAPYYGHIYINAKDIPFAAGYVWSLYLLLRMVAEFPAPRLRTVLLFGGVIGLTLGVRIGGVLILAYLCLACAVYLVARLLQGGETAIVLRDCGTLGRSVFLVGVVAYLVMLLGWPAALVHPLATPLAALQAANKFEWVRPMLWRGEVVWPNQLPWSYLPVLYGVKLPLVLTLLTACSCGWGLYRCVRAAGDHMSSWRAGVALLLVAGLFPAGWAIVNNSTIYDNGRQFLFLLLPLLCLAGLCWVAVLEQVAAWRRTLAWLLVGGMLLGLLGPVATMSQLHPYEYVFFNTLAGGIPAAAEQFETEYWITSYREAAEQLVSHAESVAAAQGRPFLDMEFTLAIVGPPQSLTEVLPANFTLINYRPEVPTDYLLATTRWNSHQLRPDWPVVAEVGRLGMTFAVLKVAPALVGH